MAIGSSKPLGNMIIGIDLDNSKFTSSMSAVQRSIRSSAQEMKAQMGVFTASGKNIDAMKSHHDGLVKTLTLEQKNMTYLRQKYDEASNGGKNYNATVSKLQDRINKSATEQARLKTQIDQTNTAYIKASAASTIFRDKLVSTGTSIKNAGQGITQAFGPATAVMGAGMVYAAKQAATFQHQMMDIRKELNNGSQTASQLNSTMTGVGNNSLKWSSQFGISTDTINQGVLGLVKNGYSIKESQSIMYGSIQASIGANEDLNGVIDASTSALETYGLKTNNTAQNIKNASTVQNIFASVANATKASFTGLGEAFSVVGATAHTLGQPIAVTAAAIGELNSNGVDASTAATALKSGMVNLVRPTKQMQVAMKDMGLSVFDTHGKMKPLPDIINQIQKNTAGWTQKQKEQDLAMVFGKESLASWNILVNHGGKELQTMSSEAAHSTGSVAKLAAQMQNTPENKFKQLQQSAHALAIEFGQKVLPSFMPIVDEARKLVQGFGDLSPAMQGTIAKAAVMATVGLGTATGIGVMLSAIGGGATTIGKFAGGIGSLAIKMRTMGTVSKVEAAGGLATTASKAGLLASTLPLLLSPAGLTIGAMAAIGIGTAVVYHNMTKMADTSTTAADALGKQHAQIAGLISRYDDLKNKCFLTNSEFVRFVDIQSLISQAKSPAAIAKLRDEADQLQKKSGLSNKQLSDMVGLNNDLVKKVPTATDKITTQGNRIADSTTKAKAYNAALYEQEVRQLEIARDNADANAAKYKNEIKNLQDQYNTGLYREKQAQDVLTYYYDHGRQATMEKYAWARKNSGLLDNDASGLKQYHATQMTVNDTLKKKLDYDNQQLSKSSQLNKKISDLRLQSVGINGQGQKGIQILADQINKLQGQKAQLDKNYAAHKITNYQYQTGVKSINDQINKLRGVGDKIKADTNGAYNLNKQLAKNINKHITFTGDTLHDANSINQALAKRVYKYVAVGVQMPAYKQVQLHGMMYGHATGASNLPAAETAMVGEHGREFVHDPSIGTYLADQPSIVNLSRGSSVLKNYDTERLGKAMGLPGFASGVGNYFDGLLGKGGTVLMGLNQLPTAISGLTDVLSNLINNMLNKQLMAGNPGGSGVSRWTPQVIMALRMNGLSTSPSMIAKVLRQINTESGGNPAAMQHGYTDINSLKGDLAKGLMQTISATFTAYKFPGHSDIWNGFDNLLASLNYAKHRYGSGLSALGNGHGYANGGFVTSDQIARIGEGGKTEMVLPLTNQTRSIQLMQQALAYMSNNSPAGPAATRSQGNQQVVQLLIRLVSETQKQNVILSTELGKTPVAHVVIGDVMVAADQYTRRKRAF